MLTKEQKDLIGKTFLLTNDMPEEKLEKLTLTEILFLLSMTERMMKDDAPKDERYKAIHFPIKKQILYWSTIERIKEAKEIYVAYTQNPPYPYIDGGGNVWLFSEAELAKSTADFMLKQNHPIVIRKFDEKLVKPLFAQLYRLGMERIMWDNGQSAVVTQRGDILAPPDFSKLDNGATLQMNPKLQFAMIQFFQYAYRRKKLDEQPQTPNPAPEEDQKIMRFLELRMLEQLVDGKFLVPMQVQGEAKPDENGRIALDQKTKVRFPNLQNEKDKSTWFPAFTDWDEFRALYDVKTWQALPMSFDELVKASKEVGQIVINAKGSAFHITEKTLTRVNEFRTKRAEFLEKQNKDEA